MPFIITDPCIGTKDSACVDVCPVDCIHPRKDEPEFAATTMLYIHPEECIDCGACVPACPVTVIYDSPACVPAIRAWARVPGAVDGVGLHQLLLVCRFCGVSGVLLRAWTVCRA